MRYRCLVGLTAIGINSAGELGALQRAPARCDQYEASVRVDPSNVDAHEHFGLQLMAERVEASRGRMIVDTQLGGGTRIMATLPPEF